MKLSKVKSIKMNKIIAQPFGKYAVVTNIVYAWAGQFIDMATCKQTMPSRSWGS